MRKIYKYPLLLTDPIDLALPRGAQVLTVQMQRGSPQMWALVDPGAGMESRRFRLLGTGIAFNETGLRYINTFQMREGRLVLHLFEVEE